MTTTAHAASINGFSPTLTPAAALGIATSTIAASNAGGAGSGPLLSAAALDADLQKSVRRTSYMRQLFYFVVLLVALAGQVSGAVEALGIPLLWAVPAVGALELGGIVVLANADVRRRLGERATASRVLSAAIAGFAVAFNWMAHENKLLSGFFAGMSALGYLVWLMHTENQRRDRLRATGDLPHTTPAYEVVGHWIRHPWLTLRAKNLAKADDRLGLYTSIAAARAEKRKEVRTKAIAKVLHRKIRAAVDPTTADIAVAVYDLDKIAARLANGADYDGLTALIASSLTVDRIAGATQPVVDNGPVLADVPSTHHDLADEPSLRADALPPARQVQEVMWAYWQLRVQDGGPVPIAAELDRAVRKDKANYASKVLKKWLDAERITAEQYETAVSGRTRPRQPRPST